MRHYSGNTVVRGSKHRTGTYWNQRIQPNGNMNGTDGDHNMWNYNARSGAYWNSNGTRCYGLGIYRRCY
jgi:hypothetical protein